MRFRPPRRNMFNLVASSFTCSSFWIMLVVADISARSRRARVDTKDYRGSVEEGSDYASSK